jgi:hypothetical protein
VAGDSCLRGEDERVPSHEPRASSAGPRVPVKTSDSLPHRCAVPVWPRRCFLV